MVINFPFERKSPTEDFMTIYVHIDQRNDVAKTKVLVKGNRREMFRSFFNYVINFD